MCEIELHIEGVDPLELFGQQNSIVDYIQQQFSDLLITARGDVVKIQGEKKEAQKLKKIVENLIKILKDEKTLNLQRVQDVVNGSRPSISRLSEGDSNKAIVFGRNGQAIKAKTRNQKKMVQLCESNDIVFVIGPAGTGKTYTAVALAVRALKNRLVKKIILTRPAVEAGENLGFLPGDMKEKVDPYLRPLYDALEDMIQVETLKQFIANRVIEVAPLAFMRGRTLDNAYIILDEAQNTTSMQIKMFLTRLGPSAKAIVTGDLSQVDLPRNQESGLRKAIGILKGLEGIATLTMSAEDVVRHRLVKEIIIAYDKAGRRNIEEEE
ncbi:MAG TPA: phosphate starvation-inducible protein PhoH [Flavobacteriales bacterium]|nr:phosphate starvation-inducible protein PhoH [Flavobacteriales bacterium]